MHYRLLLTVLACMCCSTAAFSQAASFAGIAAGITQPVHKDYKTGNTLQLQGGIKLSHRLAIAPAIGWQGIRVQPGKIVNTPYGSSPRSADLFYAQLALRYFTGSHVFIALAPALYVGGDDAASSGIGGGAQLGYHLPADAHNGFEITLYTDVLPVYSDYMAVAGLRLAYVFRFK